MTAWKSEFYIGTNLVSDFNTLSDVILMDEPLDPDCTFQEFSSFHDNGDGSRRGIGFPRATLHWAALDNTRVEVLKVFCTNLSASVYWRIPTNRFSSGSRIWRTYLCQMLWQTSGEDKQGDGTLDFTIELRHMIIQAEIT